MPRFSIKDLLLAKLLVGVGFATLAIFARWSVGACQPAGSVFLLALIILHGACATIGAGFFAPIHKKTLGAVIGAGLMLGFIILLSATTPRVPPGPRPLPANLKALLSRSNVGPMRNP
jgi:hypothetical protein